MLLPRVNVCVAVDRCLHNTIIIVAVAADVVVA